MRHTRSALALGWALWCLGTGCAGAHRAAPTSTDAVSGTLAAVAAVHGAAGPYAVAGWRMGARALRELGAERGRFELEVEHRSMHRVSESCIADGWQVATGTSVGRMNLRRVDLTEGATVTRVRDRRTNRAFVFELTPAFRARFAHVNHHNAEALGREVMGLRDEEIFTLRADPDPWP